MPMRNEKQTVLPFRETLRRSMAYVFMNLNAVWKITAVWFSLLLYEIWADFPALCYPEEKCAGGWRGSLSSLLLTIAYVSVSVSFIRQIILGENKGYRGFVFGKRELIYCLRMMGIAAVSILIMLLIGGVAGLARKNFGGPSELFDVFDLLIVLGGIVVGMRLTLILPAAAVDDASMTFRRSFVMTRGNSFRLLGGYFLIALIVLFIDIVIEVFLSYILEQDTPAFKILSSLVLMAMVFLGGCFKGSFLAHVYQYFLYSEQQKAKAISSGSDRE